MTKYYYPQEIGECTMGVVSRFEKDKFGNEIIVLWFQVEDYPGEEIYLPHHKSLMDQCETVNTGDYLFVCLKDFKYLEEYDTQMRIYEVNRTPKKLYELRKKYRRY